MKTVATRGPLQRILAVLMNPSRDPSQVPPAVDHPLLISEPPPPPPPFSPSAPLVPRHRLSCRLHLPPVTAPCASGVLWFNGEPCHWGCGGVMARGIVQSPSTSLCHSCGIGGALKGMCLSGALHVGTRRHLGASAPDPQGIGQEMSCSVLSGVCPPAPALPWGRPTGGGRYEAPSTHG